MKRTINLLFAIGAAFTWWVIAFKIDARNFEGLRLLAALGWFSVFCSSMQKAMPGEAK